MRAATREGGWHGGGCGRPQGPAGGLCFCAVLWAVGAGESSFRKTVQTVVSVWCPAQGRLSSSPASHRPRQDQAHTADSTASGAGSLSGAQAAPPLDAGSTAPIPRQVMTTTSASRLCHVPRGQDPWLRTCFRG